MQNHNIKRKKLFVFGISLWLCLFLIFPKSSSAVVLTPQGILASLNSERQKNNLPPLTLNQPLTEAARNKLSDMIERHYFAHQSPDGKQPWDFTEAAGYDFKYAGENLAIDYQTADAVMAAWLDSPAHRQNILNNNFQDTGIAIISSEGHWYVVQFFGAVNYQQKISISIAASPTINKLPPSHILDDSIISEYQYADNKQPITPSPAYPTLPDQLTNSIISAYPEPNLLLKNVYTAFYPTWLK